MSAINCNVIENLASLQSMSASHSSPIVEISQGLGYAVECDWSGGTTNTSADTFLVLGSVSGVNFVTVASSPMGTTSGTILVNVELSRYRYFMIQFVNVTATTGVFNVYASGKTIT